ncbi:MAG: L,D-transpeptidase [Anaerolineales bacterium]|nr:L,D-transpeptidase [Anaerolineales bacterium]
MNREPISAQQAIQNARQELQNGNRQAARRWAELAAAVAPEMEAPWLILAGLASPRSSIAYLKRALQTNPKSEPARQGMRWAIQRLREEETRRAKPTSHPGLQSDASNHPPVICAAPFDELTPSRPSRPRVAPSSRATNGGGPGLAARTGCPSGRAAPARQGTALAARRLSFLPLLIFLACVTIAWAAWPGNAPPALAFIRENISLPQTTPTIPGAAAQILKPTYTPTFTPTATATPTATPTPTPTDTPTPSPTDTPTPTPLPTNTPQATPTLVPVTSVPPIPGGDGERWIDVNLSQQRVYAYEGNVIVNSFLVSTGTWRTPTVTGQYRVYVKYRYTDMSGPGYYLANVPYTMYFYKGYALHGTYWHSKFGTPMSHGCVNLSISNAGWLFNWASVGTLVNVHY